VSTIEGSAWTNTQLEIRATDTRHIAWNLPFGGAFMIEFIQFMRGRQGENGWDWEIPNLDAIASRFGNGT
jgi:hypothetical protein